VGSNVLSRACRVLGMVPLLVGLLRLLGWGVWLVLVFVGFWGFPGTLLISLGALPLLLILLLIVRTGCSRPPPPFLWFLWGVGAGAGLGVWVVLCCFRGLALSPRHPVRLTQSSAFLALPTSVALHPPILLGRPMPD
jgi:hypothetical protein